jgi:hypothetical protein
MIKGKLFSEIFQEFQEMKTKNDRINILRRYDHPRFREFLFYALSKKIKFDIEAPIYRPAPEPAGLNYAYLDIETEKLYRFIKDHPKKPRGLTNDKQKQLLLVVLESLYKDESVILSNVVNRKFEIPFLTQSLVNDAFPNLMP